MVPAELENRGINKHLTEEKLNQFFQDLLEPDEILNLMEHISKCDYCADRFVNRFPAKDTIAAPVYLKDTIIKKAEKNSKSTSRYFFFYSLKVSVVMALTIMMLMISSFPSINRVGTRSSELDFLQYQKKYEVQLREVELKMEKEKEGVPTITNKISQELGNFSKGIREGLNRFFEPRVRKESN